MKKEVKIEAAAKLLRDGFCYWKNKNDVTSYDIKVEHKGNCSQIRMFAKDSNETSFYWAKEVVHVCEAFGLSCVFNTNSIDGKICALIYLWN